MPVRSVPESSRSAAKKFPTLKSQPEGLRKISVCKFWEFSECITQEVITFWDKWDKITYCRMWQQSLTRYLQDILRMYYTQEVITFWDKWDKWDEITYCRMWQQSLTRQLQDIDDCTCGIDVIVTATNALDHFWIHLSVDYCLHQSKAGTGIILWSRALVYLHIVPYIVGSVRKEAQQLLRWRTAFTRWMWHKT